MKIPQAGVAIARSEMEEPTMATFVLLYSGGSMPATEAEQAAVMQAWGAWYERLGDAVVDGGNPFMPGVRSITSDGTVTDGPIGTPVSGYSILRAASLNAAVELAQGCPLLKANGRISVYETMEM
jgi:hypothetical protein